MIKIEVKSLEVHARSGISSKSGKPYNIRTQPGYALLPGKAYPVEISLTLEEGQSPWAVGAYKLASESFFVGQYNNLQLGRLVLEPIVAGQKVA